MILAVAGRHLGRLPFGPVALMAQRFWRHERPGGAGGTLDAQPELSSRPARWASLGVHVPPGGARWKLGNASLLGGSIGIRGCVRSPKSG